MALNNDSNIFIYNIILIMSHGESTDLLVTKKIHSRIVSELVGN